VSSVRSTATPASTLPTVRDTSIEPPTTKVFVDFVRVEKEGYRVTSCYSVLHVGF
jgi:hypothetical protein